MNEIYLSEYRDGGNMAIKDNGDIQNDISFESLVYHSLFSGSTPLNAIRKAQHSDAFEKSLDNKITVANMLNSERLGDSQLAWLVESGLATSVKTVLSNVGLEKVKIGVNLTIGKEEHYITFDEFKEGSKSLYIPVFKKYSATFVGTPQNPDNYFYLPYELTINDSFEMLLDAEITYNSETITGLVTYFANDVGVNNGNSYLASSSSQPLNTGDRNIYMTKLDYTTDNIAYTELNGIQVSTKAFTTALNAIVNRFGQSFSGRPFNGVFYRLKFYVNNKLIFDIIPKYDHFFDKITGQKLQPFGNITFEEIK